MRMDKSEEQAIVQELCVKLSEAAGSIGCWTNEEEMYDQAEALADQAVGAANGLIEDITENGKVLAHSALVEAAGSGALEKLEALQQKLLDQGQAVSRRGLAQTIARVLKELSALKELKRRADKGDVLDQNELKNRLNTVFQAADSCGGAVDGLRSGIEGSPKETIADHLRAYSNPGTLCYELGLNLRDWG